MMPGRRQSDDIGGFLAALGCVLLLGGMAWGVLIWAVIQFLQLVGVR